VSQGHRSIFFEMNILPGRAIPDGTINGTPEKPLKPVTEW
jgi:hypothetical protein